MAVEEQGPAAAATFVDPDDVRPILVVSLRGDIGGVLF